MICVLHVPGTFYNIIKIQKYIHVYVHTCVHVFVICHVLLYF